MRKYKPLCHTSLPHSFCIHSSTNSGVWRRSFLARAIMGFVGAYFGVLMCLHWLVAGQQRYSRCVDHYKTGSRIDRHYDLEILPRIVVSVYCKGMLPEKSSGKEKEDLSLFFLSSPFFDCVIALILDIPVWRTAGPFCLQLFMQRYRVVWRKS